MIAEDLEYVGFWPRVGASLIDTILVLIVTAPLIHWVYGSSGDFNFDQLLTADSSGLWASLLPRGPADVLINWVLPAAAIIVFWLTRKATPGKMAIGARVVDAATGKAITLRQGIVRYLGYYVSILPFCLGLLWVGFDPRKQGFHDKLAGTVVVRSRHRGPQPVKFGDS
jgi:uncharacterized RDD family membrane protein YckC